MLLDNYDTQPPSLACKRDVGVVLCFIFSSLWHPEQLPPPSSGHVTTVTHHFGASTRNYRATTRMMTRIGDGFVLFCFLFLIVFSLLCYSI
jgi:hypothetical protein